MPPPARPPRRRRPRPAAALLALAVAGLGPRPIHAQRDASPAATSPPDPVAQGRALRQQGIGLYRENRFTEAMGLYKQALALDPQVATRLTSTSVTSAP